MTNPTGSDLTQVIQPAQHMAGTVQEPYETPDIPRALNGYRVDEVDRLLRNLNDRQAGLKRSLAQAYANNERLAARIGSLQAQLDAAVHERDELKRQADNPWAALGENAQRLISDAKAQADDIRGRVRAEAEKHTKDAHDQATRLLAETQEKAGKMIDEANKRIAAADKALDERTNAANEDLKARERALEESRQRMEREYAERDMRSAKLEEKAAGTIREAKTTLTRLINGLDER